MIRPLAALVFLAAGLGAASAQEVAPATPQAPADVVVDPTAEINATPKQQNLLTGMYATKAVIEICALTVEQGVINGMNADQKRLETTLLMDAPTAEKAYAVVKADVEKTQPDCAEGSPDRIGVDAVTDIYKGQSAAAPQGTTSAPAMSAPADAAAPATPAQ
jgi:hypothetical protein